MTKKPALGRGLSALLENQSTDVTNDSSRESNAALGAVSEIDISIIEANPFQPRIEFNAEYLKELAQSIKELGIIQPVTVRKIGYNKYQLISGERRFRASQLAGLAAIPAYVRVANDQAMLEMALVENIQRSNLNPIEVALSYERLITECNLTQDQLSERVGKQRSTISNYMRLLKLPALIQSALRENKISMGHARAIVNLSTEAEQINAYKQIVEGNLSVRKTEELAKSIKTETKNAKALPLSLVDKKLMTDLSNLFQTKVKFQRRDLEKGKIVIPFNSEEDLDRILSLIKL